MKQFVTVDCLVSDKMKIIIKTPEHNFITSSFNWRKTYGLVVIIKNLVYFKLWWVCELCLLTVEVIDNLVIGSNA